MGRILLQALNKVHVLRLISFLLEQGLTMTIFQPLKSATVISIQQAVAALGKSGYQHP